MKLFLRYLQSKLGVLLLFLAFAAVLAVSFLLYHLPAEAVLYPAALCVLLGILVLVIDFIHVRRRHAVLQGLKEMDAELPEVRDIEAGDYREIVRLLREANREARTRAETDMAAMVDYYTLWVHQIKTPLTAIRDVIARLQAGGKSVSAQRSGTEGRYRETVDLRGGAEHA